jgi:hypothetical protein
LEPIEPALPGEETRHSASRTRSLGHGIYPLLVASDDDVVGLVAYALYKQDKLEFIQSLESPSTEHIAAFCHSVRLRHADYREQATEVLQAMQQDLFGDEVHRMDAEYNRQLKDAVEKVEPHGWLYHLCQHVVGSALATFLFVMFVLAALGWKQGIQKTLFQLMEKEYIMPAEAAHALPAQRSASSPSDTH